MTSESVGYRGIVHALRTLRGTSAEAIAPTSTGVRYRARAHRGIAPLADIYLPVSPSGASVILVHGGALVIGSRAMKPMRILAARFARANIAVCALDYRMIFRGGRLDEALDDVLAGHGFWCNEAARLGLDTRRISMIGLSAGGMLTMLAAARVAAGTLHRVASCFGMYEPDHLRGPARVLPRLIFETGDRAAWHARSPAGGPQPPHPTLLLHGDADQLVPVGQAHRLAARREAAGLPTKLVIYPGAPHGFFNIDGAASRDATAAMIAHVDAA
jgi:acetyl esterase/lipase